MLVQQFQKHLEASTLSKKAIAARAGVRPELLSRLARQQNCDVATLEKIADAMNLEIVVRSRTTAAVRLEASKVQRLGLAMPYDWSNPNISDQALMIKALQFAHLPDLTRLAYHFGIEALEAALKQLMPDEARSAARVLPNIRAALA